MAKKTESNVSKTESNVSKAKSKITYDGDDYVDLTGSIERKIDTISTGSIILNKVIGCGGVPRGRITEIFGPESSGKCVRNAYLMTNHGMIKIEDYAKEYVERIPEEDSAVEHQANFFGKDGFKKSSHFYNGGIKETRKIKTRYGYELEGTKVHPILVLTPSGDLEWKKLDDVKIGDYVAIQRNQNCFNDSYIKFNWKYQKESKYESNIHFYQIPKILDEKLASFLAYIIAEGTTTYKTSMGFSQKDPEIFEKVDNLAFDLFGKRFSLKKDSTKDYNFSSKQIRKFLEEIFEVDYVTAHSKEVPKLILQSPRAVQISFLKSFFEAEGSSSGNTIELSSASQTLIHQIQLMLLNLGIIANQEKINSKATNSRNPKLRTYYRLNITGKNIEIFNKLISFESQRKIKRAESLRKKITQQKSNVESIPYQKINEKYKGLQSYQKIENLTNYNFFFDPIAEIEEGFGQVYDLTIPDGHNFFSNGLVSHNTTLGTSVAIQAQKLGGSVLYLDFEHAFDPEYARNIGLDLDPNKFALFQPNYFEKGGALINKALEKYKIIKSTKERKPIPKDEQGLWVGKGIGIGVPSLIVIDSIAAMMPKKEFEGDVDTSNEIGLLPRLLSKYLRKLVGLISDTNTAVVLINQERTNIKLTPYSGGPDYSTPGGKAIKFFASLRMRLQLRKKETAKVFNEITGKTEEMPIQNSIMAKTIKNKVGTPYRSGEFIIRYGEGVDNLRSILDIAINSGVIQKGGAWFTYESLSKEEHSFKLQGIERVREKVLQNIELIGELQDRVEDSIVSTSKVKTASEIELEMEDSEDIEFISQEYETED